MNELEILFVQRMKIAKPDNRYRILVDLKRADRPRYWNALCFNCGSKLVELMNLEIYAVSDFFDPDNLNNTGIGRHCKGLQEDGRQCPYTYFFNIH